MSAKTHVEGYDWLGVALDDYFVKQAIEAGRPVQQISRTRYKGRDDRGKLKPIATYTALYAPSLEPAPAKVLYAWTADAGGVRTILGFFSHVDEASDFLEDFLAENGLSSCETSGVSASTLPYIPKVKITYAV